MRANLPPSHPQQHAAAALSASSSPSLLRPRRFFRADSTVRQAQAHNADAAAKLQREGRDEGGERMALLRATGKLRHCGG